MYNIHLPDGWVGVSITARGVFALTLPAKSQAEAVLNLARSPKEVADDDLFHRVSAQLAAYFSGVDVDMDFSLDLDGYSDFQLRVLRELTAIPRGSTRTYGEVAGAVGTPKAARAVGQACGANRIPVIIPCHRVLAAGGGLGGFSGGLDWKMRLLALEGVNCDARGRIYR